MLLSMTGLCGEELWAGLGGSVLQNWLPRSVGGWSGQACHCLGCCSTRAEGLMTVIPAQHLLCEVPGWGEA